MLAEVDGIAGPTGPKGDRGLSCTAEQGPDSATIKCEDGTIASVYDQGSAALWTAGSRDAVDYVFEGKFVAQPLDDSIQAISVGPNGANVFLSGNVEVGGHTLDGNETAIGGYFITLERSKDPGFSEIEVLSRIGGVAFFRTQGSTARYGLDSGGSISFIENDLPMGIYYYRLSFQPQGRGLTNGTYFSIKQVSLNIIQFGR